MGDEEVVTEHDSVSTDADIAVVLRNLEHFRVACNEFVALLAVKEASHGEELLNKSAARPAKEHFDKKLTIDAMGLNMLRDALGLSSGGSSSSSGDGGGSK